MLTKASPVPVPLVAAIALLLAAPLLLHYVGSTTVDPGEAAPLEAASLVPGFDVAVTGTPPSTVTVSVPYVVDGHTAGTPWGGTATLLTLQAVGTPVAPRVAVTMNHPDGSVYSTELDGVLLVDGDVTRDATLKVVQAGATRLEARLQAAVPAVMTTTVAAPGQSPVTFEHRVPGLSAASVGSDFDRLPVAFAVANPVTQLTGLPAGVIAPDLPYPALVRVVKTGSNVDVSVLGETVRLHGVSLAGDALSADGLRVSRDAADTLLTVRATPPAGARGTLKVDLDGPAVGLLQNGASRMTLETGAGTLPFGIVAVSAGDNALATDSVVRLADATTGGTLVAFTPSATGTVYQHVPLDAYNDLPALAFTSSADDTGAVTLVGANAANQEAVRVRVEPGEPARATLTFGPAWPTTGEPTVDTALHAATGVAATFVNGVADPQAATLAAAGELPFFSAVKSDDGTVTVVYPGASEIIPGGLIRVTGDPWGVTPFNVAVDQAGTPIVTARVAREPLLAGSNMGRPVATIDNAFAPTTLTVAPPIALEGDLAARRLDGFMVYAPNEPQNAVVRVTRTDTGYRIITPLATQNMGGDHFTYEGDPVASNTAVLAVRDPVGTDLARFTLDREAGTVRVTGVDQDHTVAGPVAYAGDPANPSVLAVLAPDGSGALLRYDRHPTGSGGSVQVLGETRVAQTTLLAFNGDARDPQGFSFTLRDASGQAVQRFDVATAMAIAAQALPAQASTPVLSILDLGFDAPRYLTAVRNADGVRLDNTALADGRQWFPPAAPQYATLAIPANDDAATRMTLAWATNAEPAADAATATFVREGDGDTRTYAASFAPMADNGDTVRFAVRYDTELSPFVVQSVQETGYAYRVDAEGPDAEVVASPTSDAITFGVSWRGSDGESGLAAFAVERRVDGGPWQRWIERTNDQDARFTGAAGKTYDFRVRGIDHVGNVGAWSAPGTTAVAATAEGANAPPAVRLDQPLGGESLTGLVTIKWEATDPDGTTPVVNVYVSSNGGRSFKSLYSGTASAYQWDTLKEADGTLWKIKIVASDGSLEDADASGRFAIVNLGSGSTGGASGGDGGASGSDPDGTDGGASSGDTDPTDATPESGADGASGLGVWAAVGGVVAILLLGALVAFAARRR